MSFDQAKACEEIASGKSLRQIAELVGTSPANICRVAAVDPKFAEQYARAMELRADWHADKIEELAQRVEDGEIAPDAARVAIDARKWTASKLRPKVYGARITQDVDLTMRVTIEDPTLRATATLVQQPTLPKPADE